MQWDDLPYFLAVARSGQLARAAVLLGVDATTVGRRIRRLEKALDQRLFEHSRDGQSLTKAGQQLLVKAEEMERSASDIESHPAVGGAVSGLLRVSVSEGFGTWFVAHHLKSFTAAYPAIEVDLVASSGFLSPSRRETDVAILLARPQRGPLVSRRLCEYGLRLYASRAYLDGAGPIDEVAQLYTHALIGYIPDSIYAPELRYLGEIAPNLPVRIRSSSINAQYRLTASGAGIAVLPCFIGDADAQLIRILPEVRILRSFWLVTHEDSRRLPRIAAFVNWITALIDRHRERMLGRE
ncbi:MAG TPA: LysR family transcriptional regulator [Allosphingosinicella sp.]|nr:LysR family transcriptional regulator [Allosphingosinicella sp.]